MIKSASDNCSIKRHRTVLVGRKKEEEEVAVEVEVREEVGEE